MNDFDEVSEKDFLRVDFGDNFVNIESAIVVEINENGHPIVAKLYGPSTRRYIITDPNRIKRIL